MGEKPIVAGIGEVLWDVFPEGKKPGGAPANFAYHAAGFGLDGVAVSAVGKDSLGEELAARMDGKGFRMLLQETDYPTGTVRVDVDARGVPQYRMAENVAWDHLSFTPDLEDLARRSSAVCFGSLAQRSAESREAIRRFVEAAGVGAIRVFDINLRQSYYSREVVESSLKLCNVLKINDEELEAVSAMLGVSADKDAGSRELIRRYGLSMLILTCGTDGSHVFSDGGAHSFLPTPRVNVADTVGAGDSFTAAFIAGIVRGKTIASAHGDAVELSAYVCSQEGAMPPHPRLWRSTGRVDK